MPAVIAEPAAIALIRMFAFITLNFLPVVHVEVDMLRNLSHKLCHKNPDLT